MKNSSSRRTIKTDVLAWLQSLRFSALSILLLGIVVTAAIVLTPSISVFVQQQKEISELRESVELHQKAVDESEAMKLKWQDPVFIRAQARERLYYVMPGEIQLTVIPDGVNIPADQPLKVSDEITATEKKWSYDFLDSIMRAGMTTESVESFF